MEDSLESYTYKCRCCLKDVGGKPYKELNQDLFERFLEFASEPLAISHKLPSKVCAACTELLISYPITRLKFIRNQRKLEKVLQASEPMTAARYVKVEIDDSACPKFENIDCVVDVKAEIDLIHRGPLIEFIEAVPEEFVEKKRKTSRKCFENSREISEMRKKISKASKVPTEKTRRKASLMRSKQHKTLQKCDECEFECREKLTLKNHKWKVHSGPAPPPKRFFICEKCSKQFKRRDLLQRHQDRHNNVMRFFCDNCDFRTPERKDMIAHLNTHLENDPRVCYACDFKDCNAVYRYKSSLFYHKKAVHFKKDPLSCHMCNKTFFKATVLRQHIKYVHQKYRPVPCDIDGCKGSFLSNSHLIRHKRQIHKIIVQPKV